MKKVVLKKRDAFDLSLVLTNIVSEKSKELEFKDIIALQKVVSYIKPTVKDYSERSENIDEAKKAILQAANGKIQEYRSEQLKKPEFTESIKSAVEEFSNSVLEDTKEQVNKEIDPMYKELLATIGEETVELEFEEKQHTLVLANFEKFAKDIYLNKERMVEVYECLTK